MKMGLIEIEKVIIVEGKSDKKRIQDIIREPIEIILYKRYD